MDLRSRVNFGLRTDGIIENYTANGHVVGQREYMKYVKNFEEFREFIANVTNAAKHGIGVNKATYDITINRNVIISDEDDRVRFPSITFPDKPMSVILATNDKLLYAADIEDLLKQKWPSFVLKDKQFLDSRPIYLESFDGYDVTYRPLTQNGVINDIVIDTNLNQIWPVATGKPPIALVELLNKTTEKVR